MAVSSTNRSGNRSKSNRKPAASGSASTSVSARKTAAKAESSPKSRVARDRPLSAPLVPLDLGKGTMLAGFVDHIVPAHSRDDLILGAENLKVLSELVVEYQKRDTLFRHGLEIRSKVLFCGPPGCGKTLTAEVFAKELGLDLLIVRLDAVISSFLGETASNLRTVLEIAEKRPCVLFLDEFDALARSRTESTGNGELRRVVNSLLMMIERFEGQGFLIAATNLQETLDDALWRRFDEVVLFDPPTPARIKSMLALKTRNFPADFDLAGRAGDLQGFSYADIERVCRQAIRSAVLKKRVKIAKSDFDNALKSEQRRRKVRHKIVNSKP